MAGLTGPGDGKMIDTLSRYPAIGSMATLTASGGGNMGYRFTCGGGAIMTGETGAANRTMIDIDRLPVAGLMAVVTGVAALDMGRRLARCCCAVMTGFTGPSDSKMIDTLGRNPATGCMAIPTASGGSNMIG